MRRNEWILGLGLALALAVVLVVAAFFFVPGLRTGSTGGPAGGAGPVVTPSFTGQTALLSFARAQQAALSWQPDAMLLQGTATWPTGARDVDLESGVVSWAFAFYSATAAETATYSVLESEPQRISLRPVARELNPLRVGGWQIDSPRAIALFLARGGRDFLYAEGQTTFSMTLSTVNDSGRLEWLLSLFSSQTGHSITMRLDANTGEIIDVQQRP